MAAQSLTKSIFSLFLLGAQLSVGVTFSVWKTVWFYWELLFFPAKSWKHNISAENDALRRGSHSVFENRARTRPIAMAQWLKCFAPLCEVVSSISGCDGGLSVKRQKQKRSMVGNFRTPPQKLGALSSVVKHIAVRVSAQRRSVN